MNEGSKEETNPRIEIKQLYYISTAECITFYSLSGGNDNSVRIAIDICTM